jgi:hypothetical protein
MARKSRQEVEKQLRDQGVKVQSNIPYNVLCACLPHAHQLIDITDEGPDFDDKYNFWISLKPEYIDKETGCGSIHECTFEDVKFHLSCIEKEIVK